MVDSNGAIVRILAPDGETTAGLGVLVAEDVVLTCAHVVNVALGDDDLFQREEPAGRLVRLLFPFIEDAPPFSATVIEGAWDPPPSAAGAGRDIAGLRLRVDIQHQAGELPPTAVAPPGAEPAAFSWETGPRKGSLSVFGYPGKPPRPDGYPVDLVVMGRRPGPLLVVESSQGQSVKAQPGFSGSPVWRDEPSEVVGLLHAAARADLPERDAYVIPTEVIARAWPTFPSLIEPPNPYPGLFPFTREDGPLFFGREADTRMLSAAVTRNPVTCVYGASGVGKSSLVLAGLVPHLEKERWVVEVFEPEYYPWERLAACVLHARGVVAERGDATDSQKDALIQELKAHGWTPVSKSMDGKQRNLLIVVDQFERLLDADEPDTELIDLLLPAVEVPWVRVALTIRTDFLDELLQIPAMAARLRGREFAVGSLSRDGAEQAIVGPANTRGVKLEADLVDDILDDAGDPASLPLLGFTLHHLWERQLHRTLTVSAYRSIGGVGGALDRFADESLARLDVDSQAVADQVLLRLVRTLSGDRKITVRQRRRANDFTTNQRRVVQRLVDMRIVQPSFDNGQEYVELAHDTLVDSWGHLRRLVDQNAEFLSWLGEIQRRSPDDPIPESRLGQAQHWLDTRIEDIPQDVRELVATSKAAAEARLALQTQKTIAEAQRALAVEFAESLRLASEAGAAADREPHTALLVAWEAVLRDRNEYSEGVFREILDQIPALTTRLSSAQENETVEIGFIGLDSVFVVRESGSIEFVSADGNTVANRVVPGTGRLAAAGLPDRSGVLAYRDGILHRFGATTETDQELALPDWGNKGDPHYFGLGISVSVSDHGTCLVHDGDFGWLVSLSDPWSILKIFRFSRPLQELDLHELERLSSEDPEAYRRAREEEESLYHQDRLFRATLDRSGGFVVTEGSGSARIWPVTGQVPVRLPVAGGVAATCVLADGGIVTGGMGGEGAICGQDGTRRVTFRESANGLDLFIRAVDLSGTRFATTVNNSGIVEVRDSSGASIASLRTPEAGHFWSGEFSQDGNLLALGSDDRSVRVWEWKAGRAPELLTGHDATVVNLKFHPHRADLFITAARDGEVRLWRSGHAALPDLTAHDQAVVGVQTLQVGLTISSDGRSVTLWSRDWAQRQLPGAVRAVTETPGGKARALVLTAETDGTGHLWSLGSDAIPQEVASFLPPSAIFNRGTSAIAPDARHVLQVEGNESVLWTVATGCGRALVGADPPGADEGFRTIVGYAFSPDGTRVVVAAKNGGTWIHTTDGDHVATFMADHGSPDITFDLACDPQGEFIAIGVRNVAGLWNWSGQCVKRLHTAGYKVFRVAFSPDGERIVTISDGPGGASAELWIRDGTRIADLSWTHAASSDRPTFDRHSRYFVIRGGGRGLAVVGRDGERLAYLASAPGISLADVALSPDGDLVAASFTDGVTRIWSLSKRRRVKALREGGHGPISFSPDGRVLLAGTRSGAILRLAMTVDALFPAAASRLTRALNGDELERFGIDHRLLDEQEMADYRRVRD